MSTARSLVEHLVALFGWLWAGRTQIQLWVLEPSSTPCLAVLLGFILLFQPPVEDDVLLEGPAFPISSTFVQELFQAQYRYDT